MRPVGGTARRPRKVLLTWDEELEFRGMLARAKPFLDPVGV
jgi:hypothetical protein